MDEVEVRKDRRGCIKGATSSEDSQVRSPFFLEKNLPWKKKFFGNINSKLTFLAPKSPNMFADSPICFWSGTFLSASYAALSQWILIFKGALTSDFLYRIVLIAKDMLFPNFHHLFIIIIIIIIIIHKYVSTRIQLMQSMKEITETSVHKF